MIAVANLLSSNTDGLVREICARIQSSLGVESRFVHGAVLDDFREGRAGIALVCGFAYALLHDAAPGRFVPVAAPVVDDERGGDRPVYFSEIVAPAASAALQLQDLSGLSFAFNEEVSFSGFRALQLELEARDLSWDFFGRRIPTGSHRASLELVSRGEADAAAIDSHVLLLEKRRDPAIARAVRVVHSLGPYPAPLLAMNDDACSLPGHEICRVLEELSPVVMSAAAVKGWITADDICYDPMRRFMEMLDLTIDNAGT